MKQITFAQIKNMLLPLDDDQHSLMKWIDTAHMLINTINKVKETGELSKLGIKLSDNSIIQFDISIIDKGVIKNDK